MSVPDATPPSKFDRASDRRHLGKALLKISLAALILAPAVVGAFYFSGLIPVHRIPRIVTTPFRSPEIAEIARPNQYERAKFSFSFPANWTIDTASKDFDPDGFLILDAPRKGQIRLQATPVEVDPRETVNQIVDRFDIPVLRINTREDFHAWGRFPGYGVILRGEKLGKPFQIRIFAHAGTAQSLVVWEYWWDGPDSVNSGGFELIEETFRFAAP